MYPPDHRPGAWPDQRPIQTTSIHPLINLLTEACWRAQVGADFIPQIALLFAFIAVLRKPGYGPRHVHDGPHAALRGQRQSIVPLISWRIRAGAGLS
jgi:Fe2+ transport system protein B